MSKKAYHINQQGAIELCRNYQKCKRAATFETKANHWLTVEDAETFLDNRAYLAEVKAKCDEFEGIRTNIYHPRRLTFIFSSDEHNTSPRRFRTEVDQFVERNGRYPYYLSGVLEFKPKHWKFNNEVKMAITVAPEMDPERGKISRIWTVRVIHTDKNKSLIQDAILHEERLSFDEYGVFEENSERIKKAYAIALKESGIHLQDYSEFSTPMLDRFQEMYDAIEAVAYGEWMYWFEYGRGDFKDSSSNSIKIDVNYDKSSFSGQSFVEFYQRHVEHVGTLKNFHLRVTDQAVGHPRAWFSFSCENGVWSLHKETFGGKEVYDVEINSAEDLRGHIYWHYIENINKNWTNIALEKADFAASIYTMVNNELNYFDPSA